MINIVSSILALVMATLFGWYLTRLFRIRLPFLERLMLSYILGLTGITLSMFYFNVAGIPFSIISSTLIPLIAIGYLGVKERHKIINFLKKPKKELAQIKTGLLTQWADYSPLEKVISLAIIFLTLTAIARALYWPVFYWDAMTAYDARAIFFLRDGLMTKVAQKVSWQFHPYPPFTSLAHTYFYLLGASNPKIIYALICLTLLVTMYYSLREHISRLLSFALVFLLAANPFILEHAAASYTNLSYTFFLGMGTIYLVRFFKKRDLSLFWVGTLLFASSAWTRPGPEWFFGVALMILLIFVIGTRRYFWLPLAFSLAFLLIFLPWPLFLKFVIGQERLLIAAGSTGLIKDVILGTLQGKVNVKMFLEMTRLLLGTVRRSLNYIFYLFMITFLLNIFDKDKYQKTIYVLLFIIAYAGVVFLGVYKFLFTFPDWQDLIVNSVNRFIMIFLPLLVYYIGLVFSEERNK